MRTFRVLLSATLLAIGLGGLAACKDKPKAQPTAAPGSASAAGSGSGSASGTTDEMTPKTDDKAPTGPKVVTLPKSDKQPPKKTTKKLDKAALEKLAALEFESFNKAVRQSSDKMLELKYTTKERPHIGVIITVSQCLDCIPMDLPKWEAKKDSLKIFLAPELRDHKDTQFEVGALDVNGAKAIYTYQVGWAFGKDPETDQQAGAYSHAYIAYYNDSVNEIRVNAFYSDDPVPTKDEMISLAPKEDLEQFAKRFLEFFTQQWAAK